MSSHMNDPPAGDNSKVGETVEWHSDRNGLALEVPSTAHYSRIEELERRLTALEKHVIAVENDLNLLRSVSGYA